MLIKSSLGLIQPTLYEGGPGGGAAYNAASLGTPIIASDIPVNLELRATNLSFFQAGSSSSLAEKMDACLISPKTSKSDADIRAESRKNLELLSQTLRDLVTSAIVQWKKGN
jgi:glycosyltransferase involved in cell wall biosynthesis